MFVSGVLTEVDYLEGVRYIALNLTNEKCVVSELRDYLPRRRVKRGPRPGMKGEGPRGKARGDQEQWIFPQITLTDEVTLKW